MSKLRLRGGQGRSVRDVLDYARTIVGLAIMVVCCLVWWAVLPIMWEVAG